MAAREGNRRGGRPGRPGRIRGIGRFVYSCGRQTGRVDRNQLRNRFLRQVGSVPGAGEEPRDAGGGGQSASRAARGAVPRAVIEEVGQIGASQAEGKPAAVVTKIVDGKIEKFYKEACLLEQAYVRDPKIGRAHV